MGCNCFTCRNRNDKTMMFGYYLALIKKDIEIIGLLKKFGVKAGSIGDQDDGGYFACIKGNLLAEMDFLGEYVDKMKDLPEDNKKEAEEICKHAWEVMKDGGVR